MAEPQTETHENLAQNPALSLSPYAADPDPPPSPTTTSVSDHRSNEDPDSIRESKRRKYCPVALENLDELTPVLNSGFNFTFDTKFCGFSAEVTPKFGSFNLIVPEIEEKKKKKKEEEKSLNSEREEEKEETLRREEEKEEDVESVAD